MTAPSNDGPAAQPAIAVDDLHHRYATRTALRGISLTVECGEIFGLLGPNGGGKTTLFRILSTLLRPTAGSARILGHDVVAARDRIRERLGVVFQSPSLDAKLTVEETLRHHGHLYGLAGAPLRDAARARLVRRGLAGREGDRVEHLSGGLKRRLELAKALVHRPQLLILEEPGTGLDPGARRDFLAYLARVRERDGVTVALTTHFMDEAERCDRVAILDQGSLVALGTPAELKLSIGGDVVVVDAHDPVTLRVKIRVRFGCEPALVDGTLRVERPRGHEFVREIVEAFPGSVRSITFGQPTLEDVFVQRTGHRFHDEPPVAPEETR